MPETLWQFCIVITFFNTQQKSDLQQTEKKKKKTKTDSLPYMEFEDTGLFMELLLMQVQTVVWG